MVVDEEILIVESVDDSGTLEEEVLIIEESFESNSVAEESLQTSEADDASQASAGFAPADSGDFQDELAAATNESSLIDYSVPGDEAEVSGADSDIDSNAADTAVAGEPPFEVQAESEMVTSGAATTRSSKLPTEGEGTAWVAGDGTRDVPAGFPIKGNADSGIYHPLESSGYNNTVAEIYFRDGDTAEQFGYRLPKNMAGAQAGNDAAEAVAATQPEIQSESEMVSADGAGAATTRSSKLPTEGEGTAWVAGDGTRDVPAGFPIKGNADSGIYHPLESSGYSNTVAEIYFRDGETAEQFGYRLPKGMAGAQFGKAAAGAAANTQAESSTSGAIETESSVKRSNKLPTDGEGVSWIPGDGGTEAPADFPIKGNANSGIYHPHESPSYGVTIAEIYFRDSRTAEEFGYRLPKNLAHLSQNLGDKVADAAEDAADKDQ